MLFIGVRLPLSAELINRFLAIGSLPNNAGGILPKATFVEHLMLIKTPERYPTAIRIKFLCGYVVMAIASGCGGGGSGDAITNTSVLSNKSPVAVIDSLTLTTLQVGL